jgi:hypothetical protein
VQLERCDETHVRWSAGAGRRESAALGIQLFSCRFRLLLSSAIEDEIIDLFASPRRFHRPDQLVWNAATPTRASVSKNCEEKQFQRLQLAIYRGQQAAMRSLALLLVRAVFALSILAAHAPVHGFRLRAGSSIHGSLRPSASLSMALYPIPNRAFVKLSPR